MLTVLLGGARSGKSNAALRMAERSGEAVCFIATSPHIDGDEELDARIAAHRAERPSTWRTIESETNLADAIRSAGDDVVVIDCLTVWLGNLMHHGAGTEMVDAATSEALDVASSRSGDTIVISNEVGLGIVPADAMSRRYRDLLGQINQTWVAASDRAFVMIAGRALPLTDLDRPDA